MPIWVTAAVMILVFGGLIYGAWFKASAWNYPNAIRGLAVTLTGLFVFLMQLLITAHTDDYEWLRYFRTGSFVIMGIGILWHFGGLAMDAERDSQRPRY